jgi:hypothetical protein
LMWSFELFFTKTLFPKKKNCHRFDNYFWFQNRY